jgi:hypothetical protein
MKRTLVFGCALLLCTAACEKRVAVLTMKQTKARVFVEAGGDLHVVLDLGIVGDKCVFLGARGAVTATVNDAPMKVVTRGGGERKTNDCIAFEAMIDRVPGGDGKSVHIEVSDDTAKIVIDASDLLAPRKLTLADPKTPVQNDDVVKLDYEPKTDEAFGGSDVPWGNQLFKVANRIRPPPPAGVLLIYRADDRSSPVSSKGVHEYEGHWSSVIPATVPPGRYDLVIGTKGVVDEDQMVARATTKASRCQGVKECIVMPAPPPPLTVDIVARKK